LFQLKVLDSVVAAADGSCRQADVILDAGKLM